MTGRSRKYLSDIIIASDLILEFTSDVKEFQDYQSDNKTKSAVERQLVIIGEAVNNYNKENKSALLASSQIVSFRNRLVHAYDSIDDSIVWAIIKKYLPELKEEVENLLKIQS